ncbi:MAG: PAS domain-containing sensor histidine kinase [Bacteroidetes bacterium]|nr:MAG: PAS domain-containing sensor histidine kinase [Bacteroidota bacterium]TAE72690.1 MAG: PAS domain-containing sensor histidine kinase [Bacteroidota bacterium]TAF98500.1 MAG: PAS domain-containing sensor histidine kinase [Bacteroidota bacterium]
MFSNPLPSSSFAAINNPAIVGQQQGVAQVLSNCLQLLDIATCFIAYKNAEHSWELATNTPLPEHITQSIFDFCTHQEPALEPGLHTLDSPLFEQSFWAYLPPKQAYPMVAFAEKKIDHHTQQVTAVLDMAFLAALHSLPMTAEYIFSATIEHAATEKSEAKFKSLVHNISDIITLLSAQGHILYQSSSLKQIMQYEENELVGKTMFDIIHPQDHALLQQAFIATLQKPGSGPIAEIRLLDKTGKYLYLEAQGNNQLDNPLINAVVVTSRDISSRKKIEQEKQVLIEELTRHNNDLKKFSFITSHNLRAPLTNLLAILELWNEPGITQETMAELMDGFTTSTYQLHETLNDLTDILVIKNTLPQNLQTLPLQASWDTAVSTVFSAEFADSLQLETNFEAAPEVRFKKSFLDNIFLQLLSNSKKFAQPNMPLFISASSKETDQEIKVTFTDNGVGFDYENVKDYLFGMYQKFHFVDQGKGLGLFLIHSQITALGGRIEVESTQNIGTTFTIYFKKHVSNT